MRRTWDPDPLETLLKGESENESENENTVKPELVRRIISLKVNKNTRVRASSWIRNLYLDVEESDLTWLEPTITSNDLGEVNFEWKVQDRLLIVEVTDEEVTYSKSSETGNVNEKGFATTVLDRRRLWDWLLSK